MWELDHKESWALKNLCLWTVVLGKTLESPLDWKEIQPVHPKGVQSWIFIGRTDVETESPILWPPDAKNWLIWKDPDAGKDWRQKDREGRGWDGWMASPTRWTWVWVSSGSWWWTGKPSVLWSMGSQRVGHDWLNWTEHHTVSLQKKDGYFVWNWDVQSYVSPGYKIYPSLCGVQVQDFFSESELYVLRGWWT